MGNTKRNNGIKLIVNRLTNQFEIEENINYYSFQDYLKAKRKYLKFMLEGTSATEPAYRDGL